MQTKQRVVLIVLCLVSIMTGCSSSKGAVVFKTPEAAITSYIEGVAQRDVRKISQACAINEMSEKFKLDLYTEWSGGAFFPVQAPSPTDYSFYVV